MPGGQRQRSGEGGLSNSESRDPVVSQMIGGHSQIDTCHTDQSVDIFWIERQRTFEKAARFRHVFGCYPLVGKSQALKIQICRIGMQRTLRSAGLGCDEFGTYRVGEP